MNVRTVCLSILYEGESTGYEIRRLCVEGECSYFVEASFGSIYPALAKLEDDGLVTSRIEPQDGKPARKVYAITPEGRDAFVAELAQPMGEDVFRSPMLMFTRFAHILPASLVEQRLTERLERAERQLEQLNAFRDDPKNNAADRWVLNYGIRMTQEAQAYLRAHMHELIALAQAEPTKQAAE